MSAPVPPILAVILSVLVVAMLPLSAWGMWAGVSTLRADQRMTAAGLTVEGRITRIDTGRDGTVSNPQSGRAGRVYYRTAGDTGRDRSFQVARSFARQLDRGQTIVLRVDPAQPDRHMLDRDHEVLLGWLFVGGFAVLFGLAAGLAVWMLRGGLATGLRPG
jgi:hypothetical protein